MNKKKALLIRRGIYAGIASPVTFAVLFLIFGYAK